MEKPTTSIFGGVSAQAGIERAEVPIRIDVSVLIMKFINSSTRCSRQHPFLNSAMRDMMSYVMCQHVVCVQKNDFLVMWVLARLVFTAIPMIRTEPGGGAKSRRFASRSSR